MPKTDSKANSKTNSKVNKAEVEIIPEPKVEKKIKNNKPEKEVEKVVEKVVEKKEKVVKEKSDKVKYVPNKETVAAGLTYNVKEFKKLIESQYQLSSVKAELDTYLENKKQLLKQKKDEKNGKKEDEDDDDDDGSDKEESKKEQKIKILVQGANIAVAAACQTLTDYVVERVMTQLAKSKDGLYEITTGAIASVLQSDTDLDETFGRFLTKFDSSTDYRKHFSISQKDVSKYIDSKYGKNIQIYDDAYNIFAYIHYKFSTQLIQNGYKLLNYTKKRSITDKTIMASLGFFCSEGLVNNMTITIEEAMRNFNAFKNKEKEDKEEDDDEEEVKSKAKKDMAGKKVEVIHEDSDEDNSEVDSDDE